jgi:hypothetical protein
MSAGPEPDLYGNLTSTAQCLNCSGQDAADDPALAQEYGGTFEPVGNPPIDATSQISAGIDAVLAVSAS